MPKYPTFPTLYDEALQINLSKLKEWGYLNPGQYKGGTLTWIRNGVQADSLSIRVNTRKGTIHFIELEYIFQSERRKYQVELVSLPSNLGKGEIRYFLCPQTYKRCRILYSIGGYFLHREAFSGCYYACQTQSKYYRQLESTLGVYYKTDDLYEQLYSKHFKTHYAGEPTKRYLRIMKKIRHGEQFRNINIESFLLGKNLLTNQ